MDSFSSLLQAIYDAPAETGGWQNIARLVAEHFNGHSCCISVHNRPRRVAYHLSVTQNYATASDSTFAAYWHDKDEWSNRASKLPIEVVRSSQELLPEREFLRSEFYNDCLKSLDIFHAMGVVVSLGDDDVGIFGIHRNRRSVNFALDDKRSLSRLIPHLQQAMKLQLRLSQLRDERDLSLLALEALQIGTLALDKNKKIRFANRIALDLLGAVNGWSCRRGYIELEDATQDARLSTLLRQMTQRTANMDGMTVAPVVVRNDGTAAISLTVMPMPQAMMSSASEPCALVLMNDMRAPRQSLHCLLKSTYGLTRAEADLGEALINGENLVEYSARVGISVSTGKTHRKNLFRKTGHKRQSQLTRDVLSKRFIPRGAENE